MAQNREFVVHNDPIWRDRANFIIDVELLDKDRPRRFEQLWSRQISDGEFELCCIPFFVYDLSLGDVVKTVGKGERRYVVNEVVQRSGRYTFRVWFGQSFQPRQAIAADLAGLGALLEWSSLNLLAVDAADEEIAKRVVGYLAERERRDHVLYETGQTE